MLWLSAPGLLSACQLLMTVLLAGSYKLMPTLPPSQIRPFGARARLSSALLAGAARLSMRNGTWRVKPSLLRLARLMPSVKEAIHSMPPRSCITARRLSPGRLYGSSAACTNWSNWPLASFQRSRPADRVVHHSTPLLSRLKLVMRLYGEAMLLRLAQSLLPSQKMTPDSVPIHSAPLRSNCSARTMLTRASGTAAGSTWWCSKRLAPGGR